MINGKEHLLEPPATVADAVGAAGAAPDEPGVAAALGEQVLSRHAWAKTTLSDGDRVEVVRAAAGG